MDADVTPELIEEIDFSEKFRGYDPDQVDRFLERVGATLVVLQGRIDELSARAQRAETEVVALRDRPATPSTLSDDEDVEIASRTLLLAKRTAEAAIAEARQEAATLLGEARSRAETETNEATAEADRILAAAQAQRDELLRAAREEADSETVHVREQLLNEIAVLEGRKAGLLSDVSALEAHVEAYRENLDGLRGAIVSILEDPDALMVKPHGVDPSPPSSAFYYTGSNPVVNAAGATTSLTATATGEAQEVPPPEFVVPDEVSTAEAPGLDEMVRQIEGEADGEGEVASSDPWAPGSWSEVSAVLEERESDGRLFVEDEHQSSNGSFDGVFEPADPGVEGVTQAGPAAGGAVDSPTEAYSVIEDPYLRELDEAVNTIDDTDEAMSAFFEGNEGGGRRFGRRR